MSIHQCLGLSAPLVRTGAFVGLSLLAGCTPPAAPPPTDATARLYSDAFAAIGKLYVRPVSNRALVIAGAAHLSAIDPGLAAAPGPGSGGQATLVLSYQGHTISSVVMPPDSDTNGLGDLVARAIATDRQVSPRLAATSEDVIDHAVFNGITGALDRFSRYSPPELARQLRAARNGFGGVGVTLDTSNDEFRITALIPNAPAERAGLLPGDRIIAIDGTATAGHSRAWVIERLRGPVGSPVTIEVARYNPVQTRQFAFHRAELILPTVTVTHDGGIAVFRIASFNRSTAARIAQALHKAETVPGDRITGVVLDLRGDPGGLLDQAVSLSDLFIDHGPIIATLGRNPASHQYFAASGHASAPNVPIAVLVNGGSASASEIVATALQDRGRAVVIGSSSYGKGTVQTVLRLPNDGELTLTWAYLITPSGYLLQSHGVVPTLCTSSPGGIAEPLDAALQGVQAASPADFQGAPPRASLDQRAWQELRNSCPPRHTSPSVDMSLAEKLLADPALYRLALRSLPAASYLVRTVPGLPNEPSLTALDHALSSGSRQQ